MVLLFAYFQVPIFRKNTVKAFVDVVNRMAVGFVQLDTRYNFAICSKFLNVPECIVKVL